ncbi:hypothetical protein IKG60_01125 [Candidatus Saccharibacteria bacterium]|nr:hypothetical protein [Candidatus Saccharibacteria bacterium]
MKKRNRKPPEERMQRGARNLVILGLLSTVIALTTTGVALAIYHNSGDIYLDRSRPGYLPDEEEIEQEEQEPEDEEYDFTQNTKLTEAEINEFLEKLQDEIDEINAYDRPFGEEVLSNEHLGIPAEKPAETDGTKPAENEG